MWETPRAEVARLDVGKLRDLSLPWASGPSLEASFVQELGFKGPMRKPLMPRSHPRGWFVG
jgi:hypothetical protein